MTFSRVLHSQKVTSLRAFYKNIFINGIIMSYVTPCTLRRICLNMWGCDIKGTIHGHTTILTNKLSVGKHSYINKNCFIGNGYEYVRIGSYCAIAYGVTITTDNHEIDNEECRAGKIKSEPVEIKDGCWVGCNVTILPGTVIGKGCVIAAGSVVKGTLTENGVYAGVPAKLIKKL